MEEKKLINAAINDIWKLIKRYYDTRQDDAFWKEVVDSGVAYIREIQPSSARR